MDRLDDATPTTLDPCPWCGSPIVRVSDNPNDVTPPEDVYDAKRNWPVCVITQSGRWAWCPRTIKGWTRIGMQKMDLDRRRRS